MALRYFVAGSAGNNNWGQTGAGSNWSLTSGGAGGQAVPTAADDVTIDANSPATCTVDTSSRVCKTLVTTGTWGGTLVMSQLLSVSGRIVLDATTTISGTGKLESIATPALAHSFGTYVPVLGLRGAVTHTFDNIVSCGNLFIGSTTNATVLNTNWIEINGDLDLSLSSTAILSGTTVLKMVGTGTIKYPTSTGILRNDLTIDTSGTITFATGTFRYNTGSILYTAGTVDASGCDLNIVAATTLNCGANVVWKTLNLSGTTTLTVTTSAYFSGLVTLGGTTLTTTINHGAGGVNLYAGGGLTINGTTGVIAGDCPIVMNGTGTFTVATTTGLHTATLYIDAGAGTVTTSGTIRYPFNKLKYLSGTVVTDAGTWATAGGSSGGSFAYVG